MTKGNYYRIVLGVVLLGICPMIVSAHDLEAQALKNASFSFSNATSTDSGFVARWQDDKDSKKAEEKERDAKKRPADKDAEPRQEPKGVDIDSKRPNIKEVPRAKPKLRPGAVVDRVKVKRPPVRVKPGRVLHSLGL